MPSVHYALGLASLLGIFGLLGTPAAASPIKVTGFSEDVVTDRDPYARGAGTHTLKLSTWFEAGTLDDPNPVSPSATRHPHGDGLSVGVITSECVNSVTGGHTKFKLQPFNGDNALLMRAADVNTGTLTLTKPAVYTSVAILAVGYNTAPRGLGSVVLTFTDGTRSGALEYYAYDWRRGPEHIAIGDRGINVLGAAGGRAFRYSKAYPYSLYETDLDLTALGYGAKSLASLTFTGVARPDDSGAPPSTAVLAISGMPAAPESE